MSNTLLRALSVGCILGLGCAVGAGVQFSAAKLDKEAYLGPYWASRASYPTGQFNPEWQRAAIAQAALVPEGLPAGSDLARTSARINALSPTAFTALGPRPLGSLVRWAHQRYCQPPEQPSDCLDGLRRRRYLENHQLLHSCNGMEHQNRFAANSK